MNESILKALMQLFAFLVDVEQDGLTGNAREVVETYLEKEFGDEQMNTFLLQFDDMLQLFHQEARHLEEHDGTFEFSQALRGIVNQINHEFEQYHKMWLVLQLIEFLGDGEVVTDKRLELIRALAASFRISEFEFNNSLQFILGQEEKDMPINEKLLLIDSNANFSHPKMKHHLSEKLKGKIYALHIDSTNTFLIKYFGENNLFLNGHNVKVGRAYIFGVGSVIRSPKTDPVYYSKVANKFISGLAKEKIRYTASNISFHYKGTDNGIYPFSLQAESGQLIGVMGNSGVGKSILLNVLNGNQKLHTGQICINGYDIHREREAVEGLIGYVPQDDLLIEELTVYQNLMFNARLCFASHSEVELKEVVDRSLVDFDLVEAQELKVGNPLNKFISGGQRKRLNIALELMREPAVLFVDEPTSGLSSNDSEKVMLLLKRQTIKGKLVMVNIHQPSSDVFKLFDKLLIMDHGGRIIFQGNPMDAVVYFRTAAHYLKAEESECYACGNVNTEQILKIIEARVVNEYGRLTRKRKRSAREWYDIYQKRVEPTLKKVDCGQQSLLPQNAFKIPDRAKQLIIFVKRNVMAKLADRQYLAISMLEAPLLALVIGFFTRYAAATSGVTTRYMFGLNDNIPAFLFMSVIAALFMGLSVSAEEIIKDRRIREREKFLHLSHFSYINSKVMVMLAISAIQALLFVSVGNALLGIRGMFLSYWLIFFSTAFTANMVGLNISAALTSVVAIYVSIPLILVPQLLFSGVVVPFQKLHRSVTSQLYVPVIGDLMISRWSYEALMVHQFRSNRFERNFFAFDQELSRCSYYFNYLIPALQLKVQEQTRQLSLNAESDIASHNRLLITNGIAEVKAQVAGVDSLANKNVTPFLAGNMVPDSLLHYLADCRIVFSTRFDSTMRQRDRAYHQLEARMGGNDRVVQLKQRYHNAALADVVLSNNDLTKIVEDNDRFVRRKEPVFTIPDNRYGRAQLYAPVKRIGGWLIPTFWFNAMVLWLFSAVLYVMLLTNASRNIGRYFEVFKFRRLARRISRYLPR